VPKLVAGFIPNAGWLAGGCPKAGADAAPPNREEDIGLPKREVDCGVAPNRPVVGLSPPKGLACCV
jgi:hypothetical protein